MNSYIGKLDALDILDQFEDAVENGEGGFFYSKAREMMCNFPSEEIIHCKDMTNFEKYVNGLTQDKFIDSMILNCEGSQHIPVILKMSQKTMDLIAKKNFVIGVRR